uniref:NUC153 domain-containing protein n=1 Tax=Globodera pallida TaxID=36090 RepID=A0A183CNZ5_GLOPA
MANFCAMFEQCESACRDLAEELVKFYAFSAEYLLKHRCVDEENSVESDEELMEEELVTDDAAFVAQRRALKTSASKKRILAADAPPTEATRVERRAKRRALRSNLVEELRAEMAEAPERVTDREETRANLRRADAQRRFEEAHFVRLSGAERKRQRLMSKASGDTGGDGLRQLLNFGRYRLPHSETASDDRTNHRREFGNSKAQKRPRHNDNSRKGKPKGEKKKRRK